MKRKVKSKNNIVKEVTGSLGRRECMGQYYEYCLILSIDKDMKIQFFFTKQDIKKKKKKNKI